MPYCRNCGKKLSDEDKFCLTCGTPVAAVAVPQAQLPPQPTYKANTTSLVKASGIFLVILGFIVLVFGIFLDVYRTSGSFFGIGYTTYPYRGSAPIALFLGLAMLIVGIAMYMMGTQ